MLIRIRPRRFRLCLLLLPLILVPRPSFAWEANGVQVCTAANDQTFPVALADGSGGVIIAWSDSRGTDSDIYAQHLLPSGAADPAWPANGRGVCVTAGDQSDVSIVGDGSGGVIITWADRRNGTDYNIFAQRVLATGAVDPTWPANGRALCTAANQQLFPMIASDQSGGAIVTWHDNRSATTSYDIYAAHVLASGAVDAAWPANGRLLCSATRDQFNPVIVSDGAHGAIVAWSDARGGAGFDIYAQRVLASGAVDASWPADGRALCNAANDQADAVIVTDGAGGAIVAWDDFRSGTSYDIYVQRIRIAGTVDPSWPANGRALCIAAGDQLGPVIARDSGTGAIVGWNDRRSGTDYDTYAQHVQAAGTVDPAWPADGRAICTSSNDQILVAIVADGAGGGIAAWSDFRAGGAYDIFAQHVQAAGAVDPAWPAQGRALCMSANDQLAPYVVTDGAGGAIVTWYDHRSGTNYDIYAQRVTAGGITAAVEVQPSPAVVSFRIHSPEPNPMRGGTAVRLDLPTPERVSIAVFDAAGRAVRTLASGAQFSTGSHRFSWDGRTDAGLAAPSGLYMVRVVAGARASTLKLTVLR